MRVLGNLTERQFEVEMFPDWNSPCTVTLVWVPDLENPTKVKRATVFLLTWQHIGDQVPYWLIDELKSEEAYLMAHWMALHR